jgi:hypothetical protein
MELHCWPKQLESSKSKWPYHILLPLLHTDAVPISYVVYSANTPSVYVRCVVAINDASLSPSHSLCPEELVASTRGHRNNKSLMIRLAPASDLSQPPSLLAF